MKRASSLLNGNVSPPTTKRKIESTTTSKAVASFFKPASQKGPEQITWRVLNSSLVIGRFHDLSGTHKTPAKPVKVAAFDLDDTLISPAGNNKWARSETGWKWWDNSVPGKLKELYQNGYLVVVFSNQNGISLKDDPKKIRKDNVSLANFKSQVSAILKQLDFPISIYAATQRDQYRKPRDGMWKEMKEDYDLDAADSIDMESSFYIGDAAGRDKTDKRRVDHATSDRDLAANIGIKFQTPEECFLGAAAEPYFRKFEPAEFLAKSAQTASESIDFSKANKQDLVLFCGSPGAGKSSFFWNKLQSLGYERVNQDILKSRDRCLRKAREYLDAGSAVAIDNTNRDTETRAHWIRLAQEFNVPIRCVYFTAPARLCEHNDNVRAFNQDANPENRTSLPPIAFIDFARRFVEPVLEEGFQDITKIDFTFAGTDAQRQVWSKYWVSKFST